MDNIKQFSVTKTNPAYAIILIVGGDNDLNSYIEKDMQEMLADMSDDMSVLCLADYLGRTAEVIELTQAGGKILIELWGEINTGDPEKLAEFLTRALATYRIDTKIAIGFWSHGTGIFSTTDTNFSGIKTEYHTAISNTTTNENSSTGEIECYDIIPEVTDEEKSIIAQPMRACTLKPKDMMLDFTTVTATIDILTNKEVGKMFELVLKKSYFFDHKVNMIFSDTCFNGMVELLHEFTKYTEIVVASEDVEPGDGWDYKLWFKKMAVEPPTDSASWAKQAVAAFEESYKGKTDLHPCTLGAFATDNFLVQEFKALIEAVDVHDMTGWNWMNDARGRTQSFSGYATYDMFHFTKNLLIVLEKYAVNAEKVKEKAQALADAFQKCRVHSVALGEKVRNSHGLGFWFPYEKAIFMKDVEIYSGLSFDKDTGWTNYLKKYYTSE